MAVAFIESLESTSWLSLRTASIRLFCTSDSASGCNGEMSQAMSLFGKFNKELAKVKLPQATKADQRGPIMCALSSASVALVSNTSVESAPLL
mmetsp:Transcript_25059/g.44062  ORF Transcript_25059/g.44062 Transcript_25059/m.44062 type:complete len:93 (-) Transcript_25059:249-527(-)